MSDLKPCPFCGGSPEFSDHDGLYFCHECGAMPCYTNTAERNWNTRAEKAELCDQVAAARAEIAVLNEKNRLNKKIIENLEICRQNAEDRLRLALKETK